MSDNNELLILCKFLSKDILKIHFLINLNSFFCFMNILYYSKLIPIPGY